MTEAAKNTSIDYSRIVEHIDNLSWCALVTTGRVGSDFFQSLLDSHPEIFVFNGNLFFHTFWKESTCANFLGQIDPQDLVDEFIGKHIHKFKSRYDYEEGKDSLGERGDESIDIDISKFHSHMNNLIKQRPINSRYFLQSVYTAYALCLGQDIEKKRLFFHHIHHIWKLDAYLKDFPESKIISMTRDPRASFVSGVEHWFRYEPRTNRNLWRVFTTIDRISKDACELTKYKNEFAVLRLEDLGNEGVLRKVSDWLGVSFDACMKKSTWASLKWWSDKLSVKRPSPNEQGFSKKMVSNEWQRKLSRIDKYLFNFLLEYRLKYYGYPFRKFRGPQHYIFSFFAILFPLTYERRFLSLPYLFEKIKEKNLRIILKNFYYYVQRASLCYKLFFMRVFGIKFEPYIIKES